MNDRDLSREHIDPGVSGDLPEAYFRALSAESPCGDNLEYDAAFAELARAAAGKPEKRMGDSVIAAEPPDFERVNQLAVELFDRTRDLRVAATWTRALLDLEGFVGLSRGLELLSRLLELQWPGVHPQIEDDEEDLMLRYSALSALVDPEMIAAVRSTPFVVGEVGGGVCLRDVAVAAGELPQPSGSAKIDEHSIAAAFAQASSDALARAEAAVQRSRRRVAAIGEAFRVHAGAPGPDLSPLDDLLRQAQAQLSARSSRREAVAPPGVAEREPADAGVAAEAVATAAVPSPALVVRSREQVVMLLEKICEYYAASEPSSPLPLLLQRCQRLCTLSFRELVSDLTPAGLKELDVVVGASSAKKKA